MHFVKSERLTLGSGMLVWMKDVVADAQDLNDVLQEDSDMHVPRFILESASGIRNEVLLVRQTRASLATGLQAWLTPEEAQTVIDRFGVGFHTELEGQVIAKFYALRN